MKILKNKKRKYKEERGYGESTERITNGWILKKQQYRLMFKDAKTKAVSNLIMECDRDIKMLYHVIYNMTGKHCINPLPDSDSDEELANNFPDFFINKIKVIRDTLNEYPKFNPTVKSKPIPTMLNKFELMSAEDITLIIKSMVSNSSQTRCYTYNFV